MGERQRPWAPAAAEAAEVGRVMRWLVALGEAGLVAMAGILARWDRDPQRGTRRAWRAAAQSMISVHMSHVDWLAPGRVAAGLEGVPLHLGGA